MTNQIKNVVGIAKGKPAKKSTARKPAARKSTARKPAAKKPEPVLSPEEQRDIKAKAKVTELLQDVDLSLDKKDELLELDEIPKVPIVETQNVEWLEEQLVLQAEKIKSLELQLGENGGGTSIVVDNKIKKAVIDLFDELQTNYLKMGVNPQSQIGNFRIYCPGFLNRLIKFFPFLEEFKKY